MPVVTHLEPLQPGESASGYESATNPKHGLFRLHYHHQQRRWVNPESPPSMLWHYTGLDGLLGIVREQKFRGSQLGYQNDEQEHLRGVEIACDMVDSDSDTGHWTPDARDTLRVILSEPWQMEPRRRYVICFAGPEMSNNLVHWRGYGGGGGGYALGFDGPKLREYAARCGWDLGQCVYKEPDQRLLLAETLENFRTDHEWDSIQKAQIPEAERFFGVNLAWTNWAAIVKHEAFDDEHEWRLFTRPLTQPWPLFRPGRHNLVPYTHLEPQILDGAPEVLANEPEGGFLRDALVEIVVGPGPGSDRALRACQAFAEVHVNHVTPRPSKVPYRDW